MSFVSMDVISGRAAPEAGRQPQQGTLERAATGFKAAENFPGWHSQWAWENYGNAVMAMAQEFGLKRLCEIGGGRDPFFPLADVQARGLDYTINDISADELAAAPHGYRKARFNIAGDLSEPDAQGAQYDMMFSRMVFEHVDGVPRAWANMHKLLAPGGIGFAYFPALYAWPFLINKMIPESVSTRIVHALYPHRRDGAGDPKFPALYDHCVAREQKLRPMLEAAGFRDIYVRPFWWHGYLKNVPVLGTIDDAMNRVCASLDITTLATYAWVMVRK